MYSMKDVYIWSQVSLLSHVNLSCPPHGPGPLFAWCTDALSGVLSLWARQLAVQRGMHDA